MRALNAVLGLFVMVMVVHLLRQQGAERDATWIGVHLAAFVMGATRVADALG